MNMGYPLLDEDSVVKIESEEVTPRNKHAAEDIKNWMNMENRHQGMRSAAIITKCRKEDMHPFISRRKTLDLLWNMMQKN